MDALKIKISKLHNEIRESLKTLIDDNGLIKLSHYGNIISFKTRDDAEFFARYTFISEDDYSIYDDTYALSE